MRVLRTGLRREEIARVARDLANSLYRNIPAGVGSTGQLALDPAQMEAMLNGGARWAVAQGYGDANDLERIEERGRMAGAEPAAISDRAKERQRDEMGTLGSGNHYLEVQVVTDIHDPAAAIAFGLTQEEIVVSIHCGSRGLGHQIGTEYLREMATSAASYGIELPDLELACAPIRLAAWPALSRRDACGDQLRLRQSPDPDGAHAQDRAAFLPDAPIELLFDVSHNTCKEEVHAVDGEARRLFVHRKGATRAFGPGHRDCPPISPAWASRCSSAAVWERARTFMAGNTTKPEHCFLLRLSRCWPRDEPPQALRAGAVAR